MNFLFKFYFKHNNSQEKVHANFDAKQKSFLQKEFFYNNNFVIFIFKKSPLQGWDRESIDSPYQSAEPECTKGTNRRKEENEKTL